MITNCNAKDYGVPQNRERVFVVSILGQHEPYEFPEAIELESRLKDVLEDVVDDKYYLDNEKGNKLISTVTSAMVDSIEGIPIKNATKKGYIKAYDGDGVDLAYPDSKTRRGRVQKGLSQTLDTSDSKGVVIAASRGRNPENPSDRTVGSPTEQRLEINKQGTSNTITTVQKDNYVIEPKGRNDYIGENEAYAIEVLRTLQKEIGKEAYAEWEDRGLRVLREKEILRQDVHEERLDAEENRETQERKVKSTECENEGGVFYRDQGVSEVFVDEKSRRSPHRSESYEQLARQLGSFMQELSYEESSQEESLSDLWRTAEGVGSVQQALHQIQKIWRPELYKIPSFRIRKLSPLECWRLMGFSDGDFYKAKEVNSNSQLYKQAGNSIVVDVLEGIFKQLLEVAE